MEAEEDCGRRPPAPGVRLAVMARVTSVAWLIALSAGTLLAFSLYAPILQTTLHYSQTQMALVAAAAVAGMYAGGPIWGWSTSLAKGSQITSLLGGILFALAYLLAKLLFKQAAEGHAESNIVALYLSLWIGLFFLIGLAAGAQFFAAVTIVAKTYSARYRGTALSLPITSFGLSAFFVSKYSDHFLTSPSGLELGKLFHSLAIFTLCAGLVGYLGLAQPGHNYEETPAGEETPLLAATDHNVPVSIFLKDPTTWLLGLSMLLTLGVSESIVNSIGFIVRSMALQSSIKTPGEVLLEQSKNVQIISISNGFSRLFAGFMSDWAFARLGFSRLGWMALANVLLSAVLLFFGALVSEGSKEVWLLSLSAGTAYGIWFCLSPTVISMIWGTRSFGYTWGILANAPAIGSVSFTMLFSILYDLERQKQGDDQVCKGAGCIQKWMMISAVSLWVSVFILFWLYRHQRWHGKV